METQATVLYQVRNVIRVIRSQRVILDADLAKLYGVPTKRLNEAVKRNAARFPSDFMFQLKQAEILELQAKQGIADDTEMANPRSQIATLDVQHPENEEVTNKTPFSETPLKSGHNVKYLPYAFTEHGTVMAAMMLNSVNATKMSVFIVRTFMRMREQLLSTTVLAKRLAEVEKSVLTHDAALVDLYEQIQPLLLPPPEPERKRIGFCVREKQETYRVRPSKKPRAKKTQPKG